MLLQINAVNLAIVATYFIYALGTAFVTWEWKQAVIAFIILILFALSELAIDAINEW